jgi:hypothetical protein
MAEGKSDKVVGGIVFAVALYFGFNGWVWSKYEWWIGAVPGTKAQISFDDDRLLGIWKDVETTKDFQKFTLASDQDGLDELEATGKIIPVASGAKVLIIGPGMPFENVASIWSPYLDVRLLDGVSAGKRGIVHKQFITNREAPQTKPKLQREAASEKKQESPPSEEK